MFYLSHFSFSSPVFHSTTDSPIFPDFSPPYPLPLSFFRFSFRLFRVPYFLCLSSFVRFFFTFLSCFHISSPFFFRCFLFQLYRFLVLSIFVILSLFRPFSYLLSDSLFCWLPFAFSHFLLLSLSLFHLFRFISLFLSLCFPLFLRFLFSHSFLSSVSFFLLFPLPLLHSLLFLLFLFSARFFLPCFSSSHFAAFSNISLSLSPFLPLSLSIPLYLICPFSNFFRSYCVLFFFIFLFHSYFRPQFTVSSPFVFRLPDLFVS